MANRIRKHIPARIDATVSWGGSIALLYLNTEAARDWVRDNVVEPNYFGRALVVEPRYVGNLVDGLTAAGFSVA